VGNATEFVVQLEVRLAISNGCQIVVRSSRKIRKSEGNTGILIHQNGIRLAIHSQDDRTAGAMYLVEYLASLRLQISHRANVIGQFHDHNIARNLMPLREREEVKNLTFTYRPKLPTIDRYWKTEFGNEISESGLEILSKVDSQSVECKTVGTQTL
jgi:hypothetical protein